MLLANDGLIIYGLSATGIRLRKECRISLTLMLQQLPYKLSFTAASLRPELLSTIAEQFCLLGSWEKSKKAVLEANALQARSAASLLRMERELRHRLQTLTDAQLRLAYHSTGDVRACIAWLAAVKHSAFLFAFPAEVMRGKLAIHDPVLRQSDYQRFLGEKSMHHPELSELTESSAAKIRRVMLLMLREMGLLVAGSDLGLIQRVAIPPAVEKTILSDDPKWLAAFLLSDSEIEIKRSQHL